MKTTVKSIFAALLMTAGLAAPAMADPYHHDHDWHVRYVRPASVVYVPAPYPYYTAAPVAYVPVAAAPLISIQIP